MTSETSDDSVPPERDVATDTPEAHAGHVPSGRIWSVGFFGLLITQFFGAFLDNLFRWFAVSVAQQKLDAGLTLALGGLALTVPYVLLTPTAGWLADRFPKRNVIVSCKLLEFAITLLAVISLATGSVWLMFAVVGLLGAQSALFGPSKFGSIAEILPTSLLARGNGTMQMVSMTAIILGGIAGYGLYDYLTPQLGSPKNVELFVVGGTMLLIAILGTGGSLCIPRAPAADPTRTTELNPVPNLLKAIRALTADPRLFRTALGIAFFFFLGALSQSNLDQFGPQTYGISKTETGFLLGTLILGVGIGSVLAGLWSDGKVELGIVPLGAIGIIVSSLSVWLSGVMFNPDLPTQEQFAYYFGIASLFLLGCSAGLFDVPLESYLQFRSDVRNRGTVLAGNYFLSYTMIIVSCGFVYLLLTVLQVKPMTVFLIAGLMTIPVTMYLIYLLPDLTFRFVLWLFSHSFYKLKVSGRENVPEHGGALIVANHVSWMDGILMMVSTSRLARFIIFADFTEMWGLRTLGRIMNVIPIRASDGPRSILKALQTAKESVQNGEVVVIFAEGQLTRTGQMQPFNRGMLKIVDGTGAPIIPAYIHGLWGSIFSFRGGMFFGKWPRQWKSPVSIRFGEPLYNVKEAGQVRRVVEELGAEEMEMSSREQLIPVRKFIRNAKRFGNVPRVADSAGIKLSGRRLLLASLAMRRVLLRKVVQPGEQNIGVLLPPSVGGAIANMSLALMGKTTVNLNYTLSDDVLNVCIHKAGITHVLTSRKFIEKKPFAVEGAELVFLEDLKEQITSLDKAISAVQGVVCPTVLLERMLGLHRIGRDDTLTIVFTSGSTGEPKGVVLSHRNVGANLEAIDSLLQLTEVDGILGVLPFFHSFGFTACMWLPMCYAVRGVYHFNPLDARIVGRLVQEHKLTILMATPTFLKMYMKRCDQEQFKSLDLVVVGAEKMPVDLAEEFKEKFGITPSEGYGTTELSPVAAVNIPDHRSDNLFQQGTKLGTVGRPLPGVLAKVVSPDTGEDLGFSKEGLLLIKGPNVMMGYLNEPEKTAEVMRDGWYVTGDFASIEPDGFVTITGRQSRFSKIGGEMVPHIKIEEELCRLCTGGDDCDDDDGLIRLAVTAVPDASRGERLVVLHRELPCSVGDLIKRFAETGVPKLWIPSADSFIQVEEIPILGTGKLDLRALKEAALTQTGTAS
ncbi:MAG: MFS transporter [Planctomycetaceae bacterium]|nr:MFS transporter [Planctomycetaceae bacterium]